MSHSRVVKCVKFSLCALFLLLLSATLHVDSLPSSSSSSSFRSDIVPERGLEQQPQSVSMTSFLSRFLIPRDKRNKSVDGILKSLTDLAAQLKEKVGKGGKTVKDKASDSSHHTKKSGNWFRNALSSTKSWLSAKGTDLLNLFAGGPVKEAKAVLKDELMTKGHVSKANSEALIKRIDDMYFLRNAKEAVIEKSKTKELKDKAKKVLRSIDKRINSLMEERQKELKKLNAKQNKHDSKSDGSTNINNHITRVNNVIKVGKASLEPMKKDPNNNHQKEIANAEKAFTSKLKELKDLGDEKAGSSLLAATAEAYMEEQYLRAL
eukprot:Nk52_evm8s317 gene=Nk52_evmTU8s317